jgi:hypothetical protein
VSGSTPVADGAFTPQPWVSGTPQTFATSSDTPYGTYEFAFGASGSGPGYTEIAEIVFYDSAGAAISLVGGTASASSTANSDNAAQYAFDGNPNTKWTSASNDTAPALSFAFGNDVAVASIAITVLTASYGPTSVSLSAVALPPSAQVNVSQIARQTMTDPGNSLRVTQIARQTITDPGNSLRVTQIARQTMTDPGNSLRVSQLARQTMTDPGNSLRVSQLARMTMIRPPGPPVTGAGVLMLLD